MARTLSLGVVLFGFASCSPLYRNHGYAPDESQLAAVKVGVDTRDSVTEAVGTPSSSGVLKDSGYYYVSQRFRTYAFREPQVVDRQVVAISFDSRGVVRNIERFGLEQGNVVALSRRVTTTNVEGIGFIGQLLGNVGRLDIGENIR